MDPTFTDQLVAMLPRLRRFARALTRSVEEADDLVQDACEWALSAAASFTPGSGLDGWLFRSLQNRRLDRCRQSRNRLQEVPVEEAFELAGAGGRRDGPTRIVLSRLGSALDSLAAEQRLVLVAVCVDGISDDGISYKEAAELLEIPVGTVTSRLARARAKLHALVLAAENVEPRSASPVSCDAENHTIPRRDRSPTTRC